ncbi:MAG TPA: tRNA U-34 5-methylaminomethyl-2-thiouridine biosynthesis protein [Candidatus Thermoplasmatota archaeon]|nr:tRNA U-34 5-methylaminomethyl-2-thiouridine biosynthesis protein [Candidatus Thermoplasmatota archaeon]
MPRALRPKAKTEEARRRGATRGRGAGRIVAGCLTPHPPHLVYADNPPQNEARSEGGWEPIRWGYERLRHSLSRAGRDYDVIIVHSPHWRTRVGHHFLGVPHFKSLSVDPIFPNLFRYHYDFDVDVELARDIHDRAAGKGLATKMMENPDFRIDYGTIAACHLVNPKWDKPIVGISSCRVYNDYSNEVGQEQMRALGQATREAIEASGKRALLLASNSISHRHFTREPRVPEDMSHEHIYHHGQHLWDMHAIGLMRDGKAKQLFDEMPDLIDNATSEADAGCLSWLLSALDYPEYPAELHGYGTVIGTGNAVVEWDPNPGTRQVTPRLMV